MLMINQSLTVRQPRAMFKVWQFYDMKILSSISFLTRKMELFQKLFNVDHWRTLQAIYIYAHVLRFATGLHGAQKFHPIVKYKHYQISSGARSSHAVSQSEFYQIILQNTQNCAILNKIFQSSLYRPEGSSNPHTYAPLTFFATCNIYCPTFPRNNLNPPPPKKKIYIYIDRYGTENIWNLRPLYINQLNSISSIGMAPAGGGVRVGGYTYPGKSPFFSLYGGLFPTLSPQGRFLPRFSPYGGLFQHWGPFFLFFSLCLCWGGGLFGLAPPPIQKFLRAPMQVQAYTYIIVLGQFLSM